MIELSVSRHNPLVDPALSVWSWEIPVYLFLGGIVAGMMVLAGIAMLRVARGDDPRTFFSVQTPILSFLLINLGMGALFLDLAHKLYVWRVYTTFQVSSPMSWGSWVLIIVYAVLAASALYRLPEAWPWLARRLPAVVRRSDALIARPALVRSLAWANVALGAALGIYTGVLLNTMVARPLWNSAILGPLFGVYLLIYVVGIWRQKRWAVPMAWAYAAYVLINMALFSMKTPQNSWNSPVSAVVYVAIAIGVSWGAAILLTRHRAQLA